MENADIIDRLDSVNERIRGLSMIALMLTRSDPQEDYNSLYQLLYHDLESLAEDTDTLIRDLDPEDN